MPESRRIAVGGDCFRHAYIAQWAEHLHPYYTGNVSRHWFESSYRHRSGIGGL